MKTSYKTIFSLMSLMAAYQFSFSQGNGNCINPAQIDSNQMCPMVYAPVCGCDGITYDNACYAQHYGGVTYWTQGPCNSTGTCTADFTYALNNMYMGPGWMMEFTDLSTGAPTTWYWDFGDGNYSNVQNPYHVYMMSGTYDVCLTISDSATNCNNQYCTPVYVGQSNVQCYAYFSYYSDSANYTFHFVDASSGNPAMWTWDFGDGNSATGQNQVHTFAADGIYTVCLTVSDSFQMCTMTYCEQIQAGNQQNICYASFYTYNNGVGNSNCIYFSDASQGNITNWSWDFGDGNSSAAQNPVHTYDSAGYYNVCLSIWDSAGSCQDVYCETIWVGNNVIPVQCYAYFSYYSNYPDTAPGIYFTDGSSYDVTGWSWDFGDGTYSTDQNPYHVFPAEGYYYVCLTVTAADSNVSCTSQYCDYVYVGPSNMCWTSFTYSPDTAGLGMTFIDQSSGNPAYWYWDFGDGSSSTLQNPYHVFDTAGAYMVCLTISDSSMMNGNGGNGGNNTGSGIGCYSTSCYTVFVGCSDSVMMMPSPQIVVDSNGTGNVIGVCFSNGMNMNVTWNFADSTISNMPNPQFQFDSTGMYNVCVTYSTQNGCTYMWCDSVFVFKTNTGIGKNHFKMETAALQCFPNPVSSDATLRFSVPERTNVKIGVFNMLGKNVAVLLDEEKTAGIYAIRWNTNNMNEGVYMLRLISDNEEVLQGIVIVK